MRFLLHAKMPKNRRQSRRVSDFEGLNDAPRPVFRARSDFEGPGARKPPKATKNHQNRAKKQTKKHKQNNKKQAKNNNKNAKNCKNHYYNKKPSVSSNQQTVNFL